ncbi:MAG: preprotein translocase subunit SecY [Candidatus Lokiarchaeota archaeon]|nr:preprotein translocase subunit SecY [Candidatus Lokiarchaeota archaeon]
MPEIKQPQREVRFKEKFIWTAVVLIVYLIMSNIRLYGVDLQNVSDSMYWMRIILASQRGTLTELGIGPIVTAGLIMQLLLGSKLIKIDMSDPYDRSMFSGAQKVMSMFMTMFNSIVYIAGGQFGTLTLPNAIFVFIQLMFAGLVIILLDEILQKGWGLGSGVSLFIGAGVAGQIFWSLFSFQNTGLGPHGVVVAFFTYLFDNNPSTDVGSLWVRQNTPGLMGLITTVIIILIVVWFESTKVEIPLQHAGYRGFKGKYPMKLLYVSTIPIILLNALYANFIFIGQLFVGPTGFLRGVWDDTWLNLIGVFEVQGNQMVPVSGLLYLLSPPQGLDQLVADPIRALIYLAFSTYLCIKLGKVWVSVSGMAPRDIAQQILDSGMQVPGFRRSEKIVEKILKRYIPTLIVLNGIIIAFLSFTADSLGALSSGTGLLIAIGIIHQYAETISKEVAAMQYPSMREFLGLD